METHPFAAAPAGSPTLDSLPVEPLLTSEFDTDPGSVYERLRSTYGPVAPVGLMGVPVWLVLDYREVLEVLRNDSVWRRDVRHWRARAEGRLPRDWPLLAGYEVRQTMFFDDDEHRAARLTHHSAMRPFQDGHSPEGWELRAAVAKYADDLIGMLAAESGTSGFADLAAQYTRPLLLMVTTKLFGCPVELGDEMVMEMWRMLDGGPDAGPATERALGAMIRLAAHRRARPGEDLTSYMLLSDPSLSDEQLGRELFMNAVYLNDITGNMVCNTLLEVLRGNATVRRSVVTGQIGETVNRAALVNPPTANLCFRFAGRDVRLGNFWIRAGDIVSPSVAAAHRDLLAIGTSHLVDSAVSTRAHLAWGAGPHQCPSAARELAGMIVNTAVGRIFEHFARAELTLPPDQLPWRTGPVVRGLRLLPVRYELSPGAPVASRAGGVSAAAAAPAAVGGEGEVAAVAPEASGRGGSGLLGALRRMMFGGRRGGG
ncbi:cytochrome P450 [Streptomyces sp. MA5143a]|uniref:cytochrome P450 n=1 Tax=Streptomyces sp. MA5143a TaxID=2083010 RepID=UPI000D19AD75|nr:cytochrome P450 [Streptomyces sp. MA5143a]SPF05760.1 Cytochrome P450 107B1 [Streptomyces sp. MA5143a]